MFKVSFIHPLTTSYMYTIYLNHMHSRTFLSVSQHASLPPHVYHPTPTPHLCVCIHWVQLVLPAGMLAECWLIFWLHHVWVTPAAEFMSAAGMPCLVDVTHGPLPVLQPVRSFSSILSVPQPSFGDLRGSCPLLSLLIRCCPLQEAVFLMRAEAALIVGINRRLCFWNVQIHVILLYLLSWYDSNSGPQIH